MTPHHHEDMPEGYGENPVSLDPERGLLISVRLLWGCITAIVMATVGILMFGFQCMHMIDEMRRETAELKRMLRVAWTLADEREYSHRLQRDNPTLKLPSPAEVYREVRDER